MVLVSRGKLKSMEQYDCMYNLYKVSENYKIFITLFLLITY